jgi:hypothetical protein
MNNVLQVLRAFNRVHLRDFYLPIYRTADGSEICFEAWSSSTEAECRRKNEEIRVRVEELSDLRFTGNIHHLENDREYHLIQYGNDPQATAIVLSGPKLDKILALPFHPHVDDGVVQPLSKESEQDS